MIRFARLDHCRDRSPSTRLCLIAVTVAVCLLAGAVAHEPARAAEKATIETKAPRAILIDLSSDTVLFEKDPDTPFTPGSMAKLMTLEVVFEALDTGETTDETAYKISEHAWRTGGAPARTTTMFAKLNSEVPVADLVRGIIVQNANDACIALAEGLSGSEDAFAERMNKRARELGMTASHFANPTGFPGGETRMSARDLATLAEHLIRAHPRRYKVFSQDAFTWNNIFQRNRNPLFSHTIGTDGLKAGSSQASGYGIVASAVRKGRRLLVVVDGLPDEDERDKAAVALLRTGFDKFETVRLFASNETVAQARVFGGTQGYVPLVSYLPVEMTLLPAANTRYRMRVSYEGPIPAPVRKGQRVGELRLYHDGTIVHATPLFTDANIGVGRLDQRAVDGIRELLFGWW